MAAGITPREAGLQMEDVDIVARRAREEYQNEKLARIWGEQATAESVDTTFEVRWPEQEEFHQSERQGEQ